MPQQSPPPVQAVQENGAIKPAVRSGWIIQVGALESESEARQRLDAAKGSAGKLLGSADPFTETVAKGNKTLYRARFAGLSQDSAEAVCRTLKRSDISCTRSELIANPPKQARSPAGFAARSSDNSFSRFGF